MLGARIAFLHRPALTVEQLIELLSEGKLGVLRFVAEPTEVRERPGVHGSKHRFLAFEIEIEGALRNAGGARDVVHRGSTIAEGGEQPLSGVEDRVGFGAGVAAICGHRKCRWHH